MARAAAREAAREAAVREELAEFSERVELAKLRQIEGADYCEDYCCIGCILPPPRAWPHHMVPAPGPPPTAVRSCGRGRRRS